MLEDVDQHRDKRPRLDGAGGDDEQIKVEEESTRATNHDRQDEMETDDIKPDPILSARAVETTLEQLQKDMGEAFLLCRSSKSCFAILPSHPLTQALRVAFPAC
jgi:hypothetical protein